MKRQEAPSAISNLTALLSKVLRLYQWIPIFFLHCERKVSDNNHQERVKTLGKTTDRPYARWMDMIDPFVCKYMEVKNLILTNDRDQSFAWKSLLKRLDQVRDVFIVSITPGLAYVDVRLFSDIADNLMVDQYSSKNHNQLQNTNIWEVQRRSISVEFEQLLPVSSKPENECLSERTRRYLWLNSATSRPVWRQRKNKDFNVNLGHVVG
jgi:hypothetical protein